MGWSAQRGEGPSLLQVRPFQVGITTEGKDPRGLKWPTPCLGPWNSSLRAALCHVLQPRGTFSVLLPQLEGPSGSPVGLSARRRQGD